VVCTLPLPGYGVWQPAGSNVFPVRRLSRLSGRPAISADNAASPEADCVCGRNLSAWPRAAKFSAWPRAAEPFGLAAFCGRNLSAWPRAASPEADCICGRNLSAWPHCNRTLRFGCVCSQAFGLAASAISAKADCRARLHPHRAAPDSSLGGSATVIALFYPRGTARASGPSRC